MPRSEQNKQRIKEEQRTKILEAAQKVFARKGLTATMDDIAEASSVSHGLAYRYFANKEAIFQALVEKALEAEPIIFQQVMEMPGTPGEHLGLLISKFIESRKQPAFFQLFEQVLRDETTPERFREAIYQRSQVMEAVFRQLIIEGQASGEVVDDDPEQLLRAIFACIDGLIKWSLYHPEEYQEHYPEAKIFLRMLKPGASDSNK